MPEAPAARHDPLHVALPPGELALVVEAGSVLASPAGRMLLRCLSPEQSGALRELEAHTGLALLAQLERVAFAESGRAATMLVMSGDFAALELAPFVKGAPVARVGDDAELAELDGLAVAVWSGRLLLVGEPAGVRDALARLDGALPVAPSPLEGEMYGEAYGALSGEALARLLPAELGQRVRGVAERVLLHVDASDDLLLVAEVHGADREGLAELGRALAGAMSVGRLKALRGDDRLLADLLDESRVIPGDGSFQLEVALPLAAIEEALGDCARLAP